MLEGNDITTSMQRELCLNQVTVSWCVILVREEDQGS